MIAGLLIWTYFFILSFLYGSLILRLPGIRIKGPDDKISFSLSIAAGIAVLGTLSCWASLVMPVSFRFHLIILAGAVLIAIFFKKELMEDYRRLKTLMKETPLLFRVTGILVILLVLAQTTLFYPKNYDTALYHAQSIRMLETYPVIPGLGIIHVRFAYNSNWFPLSALFSLAFLKPGSFHVLNGFLMAFFCLFGIRRLSGINGKNFRIDQIMLLFLVPLALYYNLIFVSSPGTDTPVVILFWLSVIFFLDYFRLGRDEAAGPKYLAVITLVSAYIITVKLSSAVIILLPAVLILYAAVKNKSPKALLWALAAVPVILPWIIRNIIVSGYLIYPFPEIDLFHVDWKIPFQWAAEDRHQIQVWSHTIRPAENVLHYIVRWFSSQNIKFLTGMVPMLFLAVLCFPAYWIILRLRKSNKTVPSPGFGYWSLTAIALAGVLYLFAAAPDVRYGTAFFLLLPVLLAAPFWALFTGAKLIRISGIVWSVFLTGFIFVFSILLTMNYLRTDKTSMYGFDSLKGIMSRWLLPAEYPITSEGFKKYNMDRISLYVPNNYDQCWYDPFPCVQSVDTNSIELRGKDIIEGFRAR